MLEINIKKKDGRPKLGYKQISEYNRKCVKCGVILGFFKDENNKNQEAGSGKPILIEGKEYYRNVCCDCFYKDYNRLPHIPSGISIDLAYLLNISEDILRVFYKKNCVTKKNMIEKYGEEEGLKKWNEYREKQSKSNSFEYKKKKYGWSKKDFDEFNSSRKSTKEMFIKRHGEEEGLKKWEKYRDRQAYTKTILYNIEKYGKKKGTEIYNEICKSKKISYENMVKKYGKEEGLRKWNKRCEWLSNNSFSSKMANDLFDKIYRGEPNVYYSGLNKEFGKMDQKSNKYFMYDYVNTNTKKCIEFNGDVFHANPLFYNFDDIPLYFLNDNRNSADIWKYDSEKLDLIKKHGYDVLIIWEHDYKKSPRKIIEICEKFLYGDDKDE